MKLNIRMFGLVVSLLVCSCRGESDLLLESEALAKYIGADVPVAYYKRHGMLPFEYRCYGKSPFSFSLQYSDSNKIIVAGENYSTDASFKQAAKAIPHFGKRPFIVVGHCDSISGTPVLHEGDTIFADKKMRTLLVNGFYLHPYRDILCDSLRRWRKEYGSFVCDYMDKAEKWLLKQERIRQKRAKSESKK